MAASIDAIVAEIRRDIVTAYVESVRRILPLPNVNEFLKEEVGRLREALAGADEPEEPIKLSAPFWPGPSSAPWPMAPTPTFPATAAAYAATNGTQAPPPQPGAQTHAVVPSLLPQPAALPRAAVHPAPSPPQPAALSAAQPNAAAPPQRAPQTHAAVLSSPPQPAAQPHAPPQPAAQPHAPPQPAAPSFAQPNAAAPPQRAPQTHAAVHQAQPPPHAFLIAAAQPPAAMHPPPHPTQAAQPMPAPAAATPQLPAFPPGAAPPLPSAAPQTRAPSGVALPPRAPFSAATPPGATPPPRAPFSAATAPAAKPPPATPPPQAAPGAATPPQPAAPSSAGAHPHAAVPPPRPPAPPNAGDQPRTAVHTPQAAAQTLAASAAAMPPSAGAPVEERFAASLAATLQTVFSILAVDANGKVSLHRFTRHGDIIVMHLSLFTPWSDAEQKKRDVEIKVEAGNQIHLDEKFSMTDCAAVFAMVNEVISKEVHVIRKYDAVTLELTKDYISAHFKGTYSYRAICTANPIKVIENFYGEETRNDVSYRTTPTSVTYGDSSFNVYLTYKYDDLTTTKNGMDWETSMLDFALMATSLNFQGMKLYTTTFVGTLLTSRFNVYGFYYSDALLTFTFPAHDIGDVFAELYFGAKQCKLIIHEINSDKYCYIHFESKLTSTSALTCTQVNVITCNNTKLTQLAPQILFVARNASSKSFEKITHVTAFGTDIGTLDFMAGLVTETVSQHGNVSVALRCAKTPPTTTQVQVARRDGETVVSGSSALELVVSTGPTQWRSPLDQAAFSELFPLQAQLLLALNAFRVYDRSMTDDTILRSLSTCREWLGTWCNPSTSPATVPASTPISPSRTKAWIASDMDVRVYCSNKLVCRVKKHGTNAYHVQFAGYDVYATLTFPVRGIHVGQIDLQQLRKDSNETLRKAAAMWALLQLYRGENIKLLKADAASLELGNGDGIIDYPSFSTEYVRQQCQARVEASSCLDPIERLTPDLKTQRVSDSQVRLTVVSGDAEYGFIVMREVGEVIETFTLSGPSTDQTLFFGSHTRRKLEYDLVAKTLDERLSIDFDAKNPLPTQEMLHLAFYMFSNKGASKDAVACKQKILDESYQFELRMDAAAAAAAAPPPPAASSPLAPDAAAVTAIAAAIPPPSSATTSSQSPQSRFFEAVSLIESTVPTPRHEHTDAALRSLLKPETFNVLCLDGNVVKLWYFERLSASDNVIIAHVTHLKSLGQWQSFKYTVPFTLQVLRLQFTQFRYKLDESVLNTVDQYALLLMAYEFLKFKGIRFHINDGVALDMDSTMTQIYCLTAVARNGSIEIVEHYRGDEKTARISKRAITDAGMPQEGFKSEHEKYLIIERHSNMPNYRITCDTKDVDEGFLLFALVTNSALLHTNETWNYNGKLVTEHELVDHLLHRLLLSRNIFRLNIQSSAFFSNWNLGVDDKHYMAYMNLASVPGKLCIDDNAEQYLIDVNATVNGKNLMLEYATASNDGTGLQKMVPPALALLNFAIFENLADIDTVTWSRVSHDKTNIKTVRPWMNKAVPVIAAYRHTDVSIRLLCVDKTEHVTLTIKGGDLKLSLRQSYIQLHTTKLQLTADSLNISDLYILLLAFGLQSEIRGEFNYDGEDYTNFELSKLYRDQLRALLCPPAPAASAAVDVVASATRRRPRASGIAVTAGAGFGSASTPSPASSVLATHAVAPGPTTTNSAAPTSARPAAAGPGTASAHGRTTAPTAGAGEQSPKIFVPFLPRFVKKAVWLRANKDRIIRSDNLDSLWPGDKDVMENLFRAAQGCRVKPQGFDSNDVGIVVLPERHQTFSGESVRRNQYRTAYIFHDSTQQEIKQISATEYRKNMDDIVATEEADVLTFPGNYSVLTILGLLALVRKNVQFNVSAEALKFLETYGIIIQARKQGTRPVRPATGGLPRAVAYFGAHADSDTSSAAPSESESDSDDDDAAQPFARLHPARRTR